MPLGQMRHHDPNDPNVTPMPGHAGPRTPVPHPHQGRGQSMMSPTSDPFNPVCPSLPSSIPVPIDEIRDVE
jgi:hypothetical protein